jgi:hypothetical protein
MSNGTLNRVVPTVLLADRAALASLAVSFEQGGMTVATTLPPAVWRLSAGPVFTGPLDPRKHVNAFTAAPLDPGDNGVWVRDLTIGEPGAASRSNWFVNTIIGNDDNASGADDFQLASIQEVLYRIGDQPIDGQDPTLIHDNGSGIVYVYIGGSFTEPLTVDLKFTNDGSIAFVGGRTVVTSHTISAVTAWNDATGVIGSYTVSGTALASGAAGKFARINAGPRVGNKGPISKVITPGVGGVFRANFADQATNGAVLEPQVGDTIDVITYTPIAADIRIRSSVSGTNGGTVYFEACELGIPGQDHSVVVESGQASFTACTLHGLDFYEAVTDGLLNTCMLNECRSYGFVQASGCTFGTVGGANLSARGRGIFTVQTRCLVQGGGLTAGHATEGPGHIRCAAPVACADYIGSAAMVFPGSTIVLSDVLTARNSAVAPVGIQVMSGGQFLYATGKAPVIVGTNPTTDYKVGGTLKAKAAIPYFEVLNGAVVAINQ